MAGCPNCSVICCNSFIVHLYYIPIYENDGSILFYICLVLFILIVISFFVSYLYHYIYSSKIDFTESILKVEQKILCAEKLDRKIYIFRFISLIIAFLCAYKIFSSPYLGGKKIILIALITIIMIFVLIIRLRILLRKEYDKVKSNLNTTDEEDIGY